MSRLSLLRLLQSSDSAFPSGAFAFSSGQETLVREGRGPQAQDLLTGQILPRWFSFDRPFLHRAMELADRPEELLALDLRCHAQNGVERLASSSRRIGRALLSVHDRIGTPLVAAYRQQQRAQARPETTGYEPVVQGLVGAGMGLAPEEAEAGALHAVTAAFVSAAIRLGILGAIEAQALLARIAPLMAEGLARPCPEAASSFAPLVEIAASRRSDLHANLFAT